MQPLDFGGQEQAFTVTTFITSLGRMHSITYHWDFFSSGAFSAPHVKDAGGLRGSAQCCAATCLAMHHNADDIVMHGQNM